MNMNREPKKIYKDTREVSNFKEMLDTTVKLYGNNIAYKYKETVTDNTYIQKTYNDVKENVRKLSTALLDLGLNEKRVVVIGKNRYEWCITYFSVTTGGMVVVPLDKMLPENEISNLVKRSGASAIFFDKQYIEIMKKIKKDSENNVELLICMDDISDKEVKTFNELTKYGEGLLDKGDKRYDTVDIDKDKMSIMLFTSGTTNLPKAVMLSHYNICSNINMLASWVLIRSDDRLLSFLPIHHTFECTITFLFGFFSGATVCFCDGLKYIQKNLVEYKISVFVAVPLILETMYKKILKGIDEKGKTKLIKTMTKISNALLKIKIDIRKKLFKQVIDNFGGHLRVIFYGAASMDKDTILGYTSFGLNLIQGYGATETSPVIAAETDKEKRPGSVGFVFDNLDVKIENKNTEGIGEIVVKGPSIMKGYYNNPEETNKALKDGWYYTGDYGYIDEKGFLFITGRKKDIIVLRNGENIYPQELEFLINKIPGVKESLVYQRKKDKTDTMLCAKIVYDPEIITEGDPYDIIWNQVKEINKTLPNFKFIKNISVTTTEFSKTTTQKVKRFEELKTVE